MPHYDYKCTQCGAKFTVKQSFTEHEHKRAKCPKCGKVKAERVFAAVFAQTAKKS